MFSYLLKKKNSNLILNNIDEQIKYLFLDANCLLHPIIQSVLEKEENKNLIRQNLEEIIWIEIETYINEIITLTNPEFIYIAIDGVAPIAKLDQQRQRRYKYYYDTKYKTYDKTLIDNKITFIKPTKSIELTPATDYMERLHLKFKKYIKTLKIKCVYSSYKEENEGEHKIMHYIKTMNLNISNFNNDDCIVIYGLDADLLFLSLTLENKNIYVMREAKEFDKYNLSNSFNYVKINEFKEIIKTLNVSTNDFIILCYLVGNDFLPHLQTIDIYNNGIDIIIEQFNKIKNKSLLNDLSERQIINKNKLLELFKNLQITENNFFSKKDLMTKDNIKRINFKNENEYYNHYLGTNYLTIPENIKKDIVKNYIEGFEWCSNYYLKSCINNVWNYKYYITPLISDIIKYYPENINIEHKYVKIKPLEQLIMVIPKPLYEYIIDDKIIKKINNNIEIQEYLPIEYDLEVNKEHLEYKFHIKIPHINEQFINLIQNTI